METSEDCYMELTTFPNKNKKSIIVKEIRIRRPFSGGHKLMTTSLFIERNKTCSDI
jgi:hypothetical protein